MPAFITLSVGAKPAEATPILATADRGVVRATVAALAAAMASLAADPSDAPAPEVATDA